MRIFEKQWLRRPVFTCLMAVFLALAAAFQGVGFSAWYGAQKQLQRVDGQYTTVAIPKDDTFWSSIFHDGHGNSTPLTQQGKAYPGLLTEDLRCMLSAHVEGCRDLSTFDAGVDEQNFDAYRKSMAVQAVKCTSIIEEEGREHQQAIFNHETDEIIGYENVIPMSYSATFELKDIICRFPGYDILPKVDEITIGSSRFLDDGTIPFEEGKTYLVFGEYRLLSYEAHVLRFEYTDSGRAVTRYGRSLLLPMEEVKTDGNKVYNRSQAWSPPFCAKYTGSLEEFLDSK